MRPRKDPPATFAFRHILVDLSAPVGEGGALDQAADLAARSGARLTIVDVIDEVPDAARPWVSRQLEEEVLSLRREGLGAAVTRAARLRVKADARVLRGRPATAIVRHVLSARVDLVVRPHAHEGPRRRGFGSIDMELLRKCPCPVWIVGPAERTRPRRILAAVHPNPGDAVEQALNHRIVAAARTMATLEKGALTVLHAWMPYGEGVLRSRMSSREVRAFVEAARTTARDAFDALISECGDLGPAAGVEFIKGQPDEVIPRFARRHDIDLVVMGTVARRGLAGLLMGNTAEQMIRRLRCSVFALKPEGFVSPVEP